jgi:hypothetical protein
MGLLAHGVETALLQDVAKLKIVRTAGHLYFEPLGKPSLDSHLSTFAISIHQ